ncbi:MAG TPA: iron-containing redox enzyme family protein [Burkholderiales bacterium]|nr:iron-containing redox enzyme family protein [Burkholderiales bacterium]
MRGNGKKAASPAVVKKIVAIREKWHTKRHPFFKEFARGRLPLRAMGVYMAQHYRFVELVLPAFGHLLARAPADVRCSLIENLAEEAGLAALQREGHVPRDHMEDIFAFTRAAGLKDGEVRNLERTPAWWARTLHYVRTLQEEPIGVALAMQSTQEGQQVALNVEVTLPAFAKHYRYQRGDRAIAFFEEHAEADEEHSMRQLALAAKYVDTPALAARACQVAEEACMLRWASISDLYRTHVLKQKPVLPLRVKAA